MEKLQRTCPSTWPPGRPICVPCRPRRRRLWLLIPGLHPASDPGRASRAPSTAPALPHFTLCPGLSSATASNRRRVGARSALGANQENHNPEVRGRPRTKTRRGLSTAPSGGTAFQKQQPAPCAALHARPSACASCGHRSLELSGRRDTLLSAPPASGRQMGRSVN